MRERAQVHALQGLVLVFVQVWRKALYEWDYKVVTRALASIVEWRAFLNPVPSGGRALRGCTAIIRLSECVFETKPPRR